MISGMSQTARVKLFYGFRGIRYGLEGIDSLFKTVVRDLTRAEERPWGLGGHNQRALQGIQGR
jgi:hypothetical protein